MSTKNTSPLGRFLASVIASASTTTDCIPDSRMDEIARRLVVSIEKELLSDIIRSAKEPQDKSKVWYNTVTKKVYTFDLSTSSWVESNIDSQACLSSRIGNMIKRDDSGCLFSILSRSEEQLLELDEEGNILMRNIARIERFDELIVSDGTGKADITITLTEFTDDKAVINVSPKVDLGANARWWVDSQTTTTAVVKFAGLANSSSYEVTISAQQTTILP